MSEYLCPLLLIATVASRADSNCKEMKTTFFACHKIRQRRAGQVASLLLPRCCLVVATQVKPSKLHAFLRQPSQAKHAAAAPTLTSPLLSTTRQEIGSLIISEQNATGLRVEQGKGQRKMRQRRRRRRRGSRRGRGIKKRRRRGASAVAVETKLSKLPHNLTMRCGTSGPR